MESTLAEWKASKAYKAAEKAGQEALAELEPPAALPTTEELTAIADGVKDKARAALSRRQAKWASAAAPPAPLKPAAAIYADYKVCEGDAAKVAVDKELNVGANMDGVLDLIKATLGEPHNFLGFPGPDAALPLTEEQFQVSERGTVCAGYVCWFLVHTKELCAVAQRRCVCQGVLVLHTTQQDGVSAG